MTKNLNTNIKNAFINKIPLRNFGHVSDVSSLACFLSSDFSNYITGQVINVDGGIAI